MVVSHPRMEKRIFQSLLRRKTKEKNGQNQHCLANLQRQQSAAGYTCFVGFLVF